MQVETVKIVDKNKRGFKAINKSDFDSKVHKEYKPKTTRKTKAKED